VSTATPNIWSLRGVGMEKFRVGGIQPNPRISLTCGGSARPCNWEGGVPRPREFFKGRSCKRLCGPICDDGGLIFFNL